jgi:hypothetical protein
MQRDVFLLTCFSRTLGDEDMAQSGSGPNNVKWNGRKLFQVTVWKCTAQPTISRRVFRLLKNELFLPFELFRDIEHQTNFK